VAVTSSFIVVLAKNGLAFAVFLPHCFVVYSLRAAGTPRHCLLALRQKFSQIQARFQLIQL
jgi:hypothetical protein